MEPITDREIMIRMDGNFIQLSNSIDRVVKVLEHLEAVRFKDHEIRINKMEKRWDEQIGAYKVIALTGLILSVVLAVKIFIR